MQFAYNLIIHPYQTMRLAAPLFIFACTVVCPIINGPYLETNINQFREDGLQFSNYEALSLHIIFCFCGNTLPTWQHPSRPSRGGKGHRGESRPHYLIDGLRSSDSSSICIIQCCECYGRCDERSLLLASYPGESPIYFDCLNKCLGGNSIGFF